MPKTGKNIKSEKHIKSKKNISRKNKTIKNGKKKSKKEPSLWLSFVKKVYATEKKNGKSFKECLKIASKKFKK